MRHTRLAVAVSLALGGSAFAQSGVRNYERQLDQMRRETQEFIEQSVPAHQRALLDYGGYLSFNYLSIDDAQLDTHILRQYDLIGYARIELDQRHSFFVRGRASYLDFADGDSFDGEGDDHEAVLERAYYRFNFARDPGGATADGLALQAGRQFVYWANGLTLATVVDGGLLELKYGRLEMQALAGVTAPWVIDFDTSRPDYDDDTRRGFFGGILSANFGRHRPFLYGLVQRDYNDDEFRTGSINTDFEYDSHYIGGGMTGALGDRLSYGVEAVYEGGSGLANSFRIGQGQLEPIPQTDEDIDAWAADARLDYLFNDARNTRLSVEFIAASGDSDRLHTSNTFGGNLTGTRDEAFNALGLLNTGLALAPTVSNLLAFRVGGSTFPIPGAGMFRRLQFGADVFIFGKMDREAPIDEITGDQRYLGWEPDFFLNWQILDDVTLALRYGLFFPSDAFPEDGTRQSFFVGLSYAF